LVSIADIERVFERRQPRWSTIPTHLLLGPMFVMAKLFIALAFGAISPSSPAGTRKVLQS